MPVVVRSFKRSKFNVRTDAAGKAARTVDGITFDSLKEAKRYAELKLLERAGEITGLQLQPKFALWTYCTEGLETDVSSIRTVCEYWGDFLYQRKDGVKIVEDVKGADTDMSRLKRKWLKLQNNIDVVIL